MTRSTELAPVATRAPVAARTGQRWTRRRGFTGTLAAVAVVGFAAAIVAPTGMSLAQPAEAAETSMYALAASDAQDLTVTVEGGATISPVDRSGYSVYVTPKPKPTPKPATAGGGGSSSPPRYTGGGSPAEWMAAAGIAESDWGYVDYIVKRESGWNPNATNKRSGACGLVQALPCSKVPGSGYNPVDNLRWANGYATGRYGSWAGAYAFWTSHHWW